MSIRSFNDLRIAPFSALLDSQIGLPDHQGGPDFDNWDYEIETRHCRYGRSPIDTKPKPPIKDPEYVKGEFGYIGPCCLHFGHQVADFSMRILPTLATGFEGKLIVGTKQSGPSEFHETPTFFRQIISWFDITSERILLPKADSIFEKVYIAPQAETIFGPVPSTEHLETLTEHYSKKTYPLKDFEEKSEIVYISRTRIGRGVFAGEAALEAYMKSIGARIIFPELEDISKLLKIYNDAEYIFGGEGSAFHLLQFLGSQVKNVVIIRRSADSNFWGHDFIRCRCKNLQYIDAVIGGISGREDGRYREEGLALLDPDSLCKQLGDILPVNEPMNKTRFEQAEKESLYCWLMNYWYNSKTFDASSLDIIISEARKANILIKSEVIDVARTKYSGTLSDSLKKVVVERDPSTNLATYQLRAAVILGLSGDKIGLNILKDTLEVKNNTWIDYGQVAQAAYRLSEHEIAHKSVVKALAGSINQFWLWELQAHILLSMNDLEGAKKSAMMALSIDSSRPDTLFLLSMTYHRMGNLELALLAINAALKISSKPHFTKLRLCIENLLNTREDLHHV
ncbi:glycosyltransferase family 61 protein [Synechococcus sp. BA-120 BA3]|nr:glycosyltransferase family 61 protein [Synechococcus sp. BA-120 BA3]